MSVFPAASVDEQYTVVSPIRNISSDEWEQFTSRWKSTLSVAVEFSRTVDDELSPSSVVEDLFGQFRIGASSSARKQKFTVITLIHILREWYNDCQLRFDDIINRVEKRIRRYISFHDQEFEFLQMINKC